MKRFVVLLLTWLALLSAKAQTNSTDTTVEVSLGFQQVKMMLLKANITLLSGYYHVETQTKLWSDSSSANSLFFFKL